MSGDRRYFNPGEGSSTSKEVNSGLEKTNGSLDVTKNASKKLEKLKLEEAWKEQKERHEDLTRRIKTDNWEQRLTFAHPDVGNLPDDVETALQSIQAKIKTSSVWEQTHEIQHHEIKKEFIEKIVN
jgi:hypothetical protein